jgi:hypothetical protein
MGRSVSPWLEAALLPDAVAAAWRAAPVEEKAAPVEPGRGVDTPLVGPQHHMRMTVPTLMHRSRLSLPSPALRSVARRGGMAGAYTRPLFGSA